MNNVRLIWWMRVKFQNITVEFIIVVIDILYNYAGLGPLKSKYGIAIKDALEHVFTEKLYRKKNFQLLKIKLFAKHSERKTQIVERLREGNHVSVFHKEKHKNLTTEVSKWLLKMLTKVKETVQSI